MTNWLAKLEEVEFAGPGRPDAVKTSDAYAILKEAVAQAREDARRAAFGDAMTLVRAIGDDLARRGLTHDMQVAARIESQLGDVWLELKKTTKGGK